jgi:hypothetical protein
MSILLVVAGFLGIAGLPAVVVADERPPMPFEVTELASGVFVHYGIIADRTRENLGDNANVGFIVGSRCVAHCARRSAKSRRCRSVTWC